MTTQFRSIENWKEALLNLKDGPFFDIMRTYLGEIQTPFNKQHLVEELVAFLSQSEIQATVAAYLDTKDILFLSAIFYLAEPTQEELASFFEGELTFSELYNSVLNLEERLLIFRVYEEKKPKLCINPVFQQILISRICDPAVLFPSQKLPEQKGINLPVEKPEKTSTPPVTPAILGALFSFLYGSQSLFKKDGALKKKAGETLRHLFPDEDTALLMQILIQAFRFLDLLEVEDGLHAIHTEQVHNFAQLSLFEQLEYLVVAIVGSTQNDRIAIFFEKHKWIEVWVNKVHLLLKSLKPGYQYPYSTLRKLLWVIEHVVYPADKQNNLYDESFVYDTVLHVLEQTGILVFDAQKNGSLSEMYIKQTAAISNESNKSATQTPMLALDGFTCIVYPEISLSDAILIAISSKAIEIGPTIHFEITRDRMIQAFDMGYKAQVIVDTLERLSCHKVPEQVRWSILEWEKRYNTVALYRGLILVLDEERRYLVDTEPLASWVIRALAPGVYQLRVHEEAIVIQALNKLGIDVVGLPPDPESLNKLSKSKKLYGMTGVNFIPAGKKMNKKERTVQAFLSSEPEEESISSSRFQNSSSYPIKVKADERLQSLREILQQKSFDRQHVEEFMNRINRRVILDESQLTTAAIKHEKFEARGLDYAGKVRIVEQAISQRSLVEVFWRGAKGEPLSIIGKPIILEKFSGELILFIVQVPRGEQRNIELGKISLIRRIKQSIFSE
jgi:hypothetical protein